MFILPTEFISNLDEKCIQQNAVDLRVNSVELLHSLEFNAELNPLVVLQEQKTVHHIPQPIPIDPTNNSWLLKRGIYKFETNHYVDVPSGHCGWLITRSSLNRNGIFILSGLYDSGFKGYVGGTLYNMGCHLLLEHNTRVCQFVLAKAQTEKLYEGSYQDRINT